MFEDPPHKIGPSIPVRDYTSNLRQVKFLALQTKAFTYGRARFISSREETTIRNSKLLVAIKGVDSKILAPFIFY